MIPAQGGRRPPAVLRGARRQPEAGPRATGGLALHASRLPFFPMRFCWSFDYYFFNLKGFRFFLLLLDPPGRESRSRGRDRDPGGHGPGHGHPLGP